MAKRGSTETMYWTLRDAQAMVGLYGPGARADAERKYHALRLEARGEAVRATAEHLQRVRAAEAREAAEAAAERA